MANILLQQTMMMMMMMMMMVEVHGIHHKPASF
jgi:hypothetical protein